LSNYARIYGNVVNEPTFSHSIYGEDFYTFDILANRLSGRADLIPCVASEKYLDFTDGREKRLFCGQIRSYNKIIEGISRLDIRMFVKDIFAEAAEESLNSVLLTGYICKAPVYRRTPFGREITDILLAVNRAHNKSDYIPVILWGKNAREVGEYKVGDKLKLEGRLQSREYEKTLENGKKIKRMTFEVSAAEMQKITEEIL